MNVVKTKLISTEALLNSLSYENVLERGYCVLSSNVEFITEDKIAADDEIEVITYHKKINSKVIDIKERKKTDGKSIDV